MFKISKCGETTSGMESLVHNIKKAKNILCGHGHMHLNNKNRMYVYNIIETGIQNKSYFIYFFIYIFFLMRRRKPFIKEKLSVDG